MRDLRQARNELVPQRGDLLRVLVDVCAGFLQRGGHAHDRRDVFRTGALAALLGAALDQRRQDHALTGVEHADALRAVELMC